MFLFGLTEHILCVLYHPLNSYIYIYIYKQQKKHSLPSCMIATPFGCLSTYMWKLTSYNNPLFVCYVTNSVMSVYSFNCALTMMIALHLSDWCHYFTGHISSS